LTSFSIIQYVDTDEYIMINHATWAAGPRRETENVEQF
jgi:hypothetical protein